MIPCNPEAFQLMMEGSAAFSDMEQNGIRIDLDYFKRMEIEVGNKIAELEEKLKKDEAWIEWTKRFGLSADLGKRQQLADIAFDYFKIRPKGMTTRETFSTNKEAFEGVNIPFIRTWTNVAKLKRTRATDIRGIISETVDGVLRCVQNLHIAITYRSTCTDPNMQNKPNRDPREAKLVRRGFVPWSDDYVLIEVDFSGAEVRAACPYHNDPTMIQYIIDDHDLHMDMACECYKLRPDQVSKPIRGTAKAAYVFASFYGDWYIQICQNLWSKVDLDDLKLTNGTMLRDHLNSVGLSELGELDPKNTTPDSFEAHIKEVDRAFWGERFPVYTEWKERWWKDYLSKGWVQSKIGFVSQGIFERNKIINFPIQGTAFHFLLWVVIELNKWLKSNGMRSRLNLQIHDSVLIDAHKNEVQDVLFKIKELVTVGLHRKWPWINVPMAVESFVCEENWFGKKEWVEIGGTWKEKPKKVA